MLNVAKAGLKLDRSGEGGEIFRKTGYTGEIHPVHPVLRILLYK
jgi:hypothetical protein